MGRNGRDAGHGGKPVIIHVTNGGEAHGVQAERNALRNPESVAEFGTIDATHVELRGVCSRCAREQAGQPEKNENPKEPGGKERSTP
jgi:hypothetical protein